ncbi:DUF406 family protein [Thaumasiovibrio sp. DFM-14]|uniref:DUF406 family protein n=1 Tax=Thaumasiovibrio sp. DFM-14 TaxID=3384792 RepID=UPI0039A313A4
MIDKTNELETCEACGVSAEMGFIIKEGDDIANVFITAPSQEEAVQELNKFVVLANEVNERVTVQSAYVDGKLNANIQFECSAEKLIFELRSRSIR